jgi:hypothetical protein
MNWSSAAKLLLIAFPRLRQPIVDRPLSVVAYSRSNRRAGNIFFWPGWPGNIDPQVSATLRDNLGGPAADNERDRGAFPRAKGAGTWSHSSGLSWFFL